VVSLKPLDYDSCDPLLAFIEKELFLIPPVPADIGHLSHIHQTVVVAARGLDLLVYSCRQLETSDHILSRSASDNSEPAGGIDHRPAPGKSVHDFVNSSVAPDDEHKFSSAFDSRTSRVFRIQRPRGDEHGVIAANTAGDLVEDLRLPPTRPAA